MTEFKFSKQTEKPIVETSSGLVEGIIRNNNAVFYGIPFGKDCDMDNRFLPPQECEGWQGIKECKVPSHKAMQEDSGLSDNKKKPKFLEEITKLFSGGIEIKQRAIADENCLNLSVVSPCIDDKKRAVLVYIHGGGFTGGESFIIPTICDKLCDEEDVVVVSIEHRLGAYGFLDLSHFDEKYKYSGINGMLDIILGLKWVKNNIGKFGGNPENVMLYGESGGAMKITTLLNMPCAKGLFNKAYLNSGACKAGIVSKEDGLNYTREFLKAANIEESNWRELLTMDNEAIINAQKKVSGNSALTPFYPVADGEYLKYNATDDYCISEAYDDVPIMLGASEDELMLMPLKIVFFRSQIKKELFKRQSEGAITGLNHDNIDGLIDTYRNHDKHPRNHSHTLAFILSSYSFLGSGAYYLALKKAQQKANVYLYEVAYDTALLGNKLASAWHTADLPLSFRAVYYKEHERISKHMAHAMANFMKTGNPSSEEMEWLPFDEENEYTLIYGYQNDECKKGPYCKIHDLVNKHRGNCL